MKILLVRTTQNTTKRAGARLANVPDVMCHKIMLSLPFITFSLPGFCHLATFCFFYFYKLWYFFLISTASNLVLFMPKPLLQYSFLSFLSYFLLKLFIFIVGYFITCCFLVSFILFFLQLFLFIIAYFLQCSFMVTFFLCFFLSYFFLSLPVTTMFIFDLFISLFSELFLFIIA